MEKETTYLVLKFSLIKTKKVQTRSAAFKQEKADGVFEEVFIFIFGHIVHVDAWRLTVYFQVNECVKVCMGTVNVYLTCGYD